MSNGIERLKKYLKKYSKDFIVIGGIGFGYLIVLLVLVIKGEEGVLDWFMEWGVNSLMIMVFVLIFHFTFGKKLNKRYLNKRLKEKEGEE